MHHSKFYACFRKECNWLKNLLALVIPGLKLFDFTAVFVASSAKQNHEKITNCVSAIVIVSVTISCSLVG